MIEAARRVVAIVDASTSGNDQTFGCADVEYIDVLITASGHAGGGWPARAGYGIKRVEGGT